MGMTDPVADMLTRVRNASGAKFAKVDIPSSKLKVQIARILKDEGYIKNFKVIKDNRQGILRIYLRYDEKNREVIQYWYGSAGRADGFMPVTMPFPRF